MTGVARLRKRDPRARHPVTQRLELGARAHFNGGQLELEDLKLTVEDLERFGPTLIVDHKSTGGERVLVWSQ